MLMKVEKREIRIKAVKVSRRGPMITRFHFIDNCILFREATEKGANELKGILEQYENLLGQSINFDKSTLFFNSNSLVRVKEMITQNLRVRCLLYLKKYLGLLYIVER